MEMTVFNEIVEGLKRRLELLKAYGVVDAPVERDRPVVVCASGKPGASVVFVEGVAGAAGAGETPSPPFPGDERELLEKIVISLGLGMDDVYLCSIASRGSQGGEGGQGEGEDSEAPAFDQEIKRLSPRVIVTMGEAAARSLLTTRAPLKELRGRFHGYAAIKLMPTHHPAELIKNPALKRETWNDMKMVIEVLLTANQ